MPVISVLQSKGGVGKTTLAVHIARGLQLRGHRTVLIDADRQGSSYQWSQSGEDSPVTVSSETPQGIRSILKKADAKGDTYCVIDGAAHLKVLDAAIIQCSDVLLIPIQPSPVDVWATKDIVRLAHEREDLRAAFVLSRRKAGTRLNDTITEVLRQFDLPVLPGTYDRVAYAMAMGKGRSVEESQDSKAASEVEDIISFCLNGHASSLS